MKCGVIGDVSLVARWVTSRGILGAKTRMARTAARKAQMMLAVTREEIRKPTKTVVCWAQPSVVGECASGEWESLKEYAEQADRCFEIDAERADRCRDIGA